LPSTINALIASAATINALIAVAVNHQLNDGGNR
jgi:hypothetical protein